MIGHRYVTEYRFEQAIEEIYERIDSLMASQAENQASIDAEKAAIDAIQPKLVTVQQEIDALKANPAAQSLDFTKLDAAIAAVGTQADTDVADAAPPAPPVVP